MDFKNRNGINFDTIANLRTDVDTLKRNIGDAKIDLQDLRVENSTVKDIAEQKSVEVQRFKNELGEANQQNESLADAKRRLELEVNAFSAIPSPKAILLVRASQRGEEKTNSPC